MADKKIIDAMWDDSPVDVSTEVNFIWSIANKLRGTYQSDKYKDVIIPMVIIRRFECALAPTKAKVVETYKANPGYPAKAMYRLSGFQFYNTSEFDLAELVNDSDHLAANFKAYIQGFSANIQDIIRSLDFDKQIDKMDKNNRLLSVVKAFSELDLNPRTIDNVKMGYIFEDLIRKFSENAEAGDHYTGRDIIKLMVNILLAEGCDDIFDDGKVITVLDITWLIFLVAAALRCAGQPMKAVLRAWFPRCPAKRTAALTRRRKAAPTRSARGRRRCASPRRRAMWSWRRWPDGIRIFENSKNIKTERTGRLPRGVRPVRLFLCDRRHAFGAFCLPVTDSISMHQTAV